MELRIGRYLVFAIILVAGTAARGQTFTIVPSAPLPVLSATPSVLNFGSTVIGTSPSINLTVSAPRYPSIALTVTATADDPAFSIPTGPVTIPPGGTGVVKVTFSPTARGTVNGSITLTAASGATIGFSALFNGFQVFGSIAVAATGTGTGTPRPFVPTLQPGGIIPSEIQGGGYAFKLTATGGTLPYRWTAANLPAGLMIDSRTGQIYGSVPAPGTYRFTVVSQDATGLTSQPQTLSFTSSIGSFPVSFVTKGLLPGIVASPYGPSLMQAAGTTGPFIFTVNVNDTLPPGVTLDPDGTLHGAPQTPGSYHFRLIAAKSSDPTQFAPGQFSMYVTNPLVARVVEGGAWATTFQLMNLGAAAATFAIAFHAEDGTDLRLGFTDSPAQVASRAVTIQPNGSVTLETAGDPARATVDGWAELQVGPADTVAGTAIVRQRVNGRQDFEAAVPVTNKLSTRTFLPFDSTPGFNTNVTATNPAPDPVSLTYLVRDEQGHQLSPGAPANFPGMAHQVLPAPATFASGLRIRGVVELDEPCSATAGTCNGTSAWGLRAFDNGAFTSYAPLFIDDNAPPVTTPVHLTAPRIVDGGGFRTNITLINMNNPLQLAPAQVTLTFSKGDGSAWALPLNGFSDQLAQRIVSIPTGGAVTLETSGNTFGVGWADVQINPGDKVGGVALFRQTQASGAAYEAIQSIASASLQAAMPFDVSPRSGRRFRTDISITNPNSSPNTVTLNIFNEDGTPLVQNYSVPLNGGQETAFELGDQLSQVVNKRGVIRFLSSSSFAIVGLRTNPTDAWTSYNPVTQ